METTHPNRTRTFLRVPDYSRAADPTATRFRRLHDLLAEIEMLYGMRPAEAASYVATCAELGTLDYAFGWEDPTGEAIPEEEELAQQQGEAWADQRASRWFENRGER